jgi:hypothetical protein
MRGNGSLMQPNFGCIKDPVYGFRGSDASYLLLNDIGERLHGRSEQY